MSAFVCFLFMLFVLLLLSSLIPVIATSIRRANASRKGPLRTVASHALHRDHMPGGIAYAWGQCVCVRAVHMMLSISISISFSISVSIRISINIIISEGFQSPKAKFVRFKSLKVCNSCIFSGF